MLLYYDDHIIVTDSRMIFGQNSINISSPVTKIYSVGQFVIVACPYKVYVFCRVTCRFDLCDDWTDSFFVNVRANSVILVRKDREDYHYDIRLWTGHCYWHQRLIQFCINDLYVTFDEDLPTVVLRNSVDCHFRWSRDFEDISVQCDV